VKDYTEAAFMQGFAQKMKKQNKNKKQWRVKTLNIGKADNR
jgi:hypothetical protein